MCGINGIVRLSGTREEIDRAELLRTRDYMASRGPDGAGEWISAEGEVGLGHRRLAIIDLSAKSDQPLSRQNGRYQIVFNGEIYNYQELRRSLITKGITFSSQGDTEVLLALYETEGPAMLTRLRGMFTFAIWDQIECTLFLARDPYGIKPLYYSSSGGYFRFASQARALLNTNNLSDSVSPAGLIGFLLWGSVPEPHTIWNDIKALRGGYYMSVTNGVISSPQPYYKFGQYPHPEVPSLNAAFEDTVKAHLVSDVPVAVFLSSGVDSCLLAALASRHMTSPPVTLTITFDQLVGTPQDEGPLAAEIADRLGTQHIEQRITATNFPDLWECTLQAMDQPSIDGFNTFVISRIAHDHGLKVVLS